MNQHRANRIRATIERKGFKAIIEKSLDGYRVIAFGKEGQEREIRNAVPYWQWFFYWLHSQTIHEQEPPGTIIVVFE